VLPYAAFSLFHAMRRSRKSRAGSGGSPVSLQNFIILLLVLLLIINFFDFYLDHFGGNKVPKATKQDMASVPPQKQAIPESKVAAESLKTVTGSLVPAIKKPAPVPLLTADMPPPGEIQIQVLNGCGTPGIAGKVRSALRSQGFDILSFGNANSQNYEKTVIWARSALPFSEQAARRLAHMLGISADQISIQENLGMGDIDVTLILGFDYQTLNLTGR